MCVHVCKGVCTCMEHISDSEPVCGCGGGAAAHYMFKFAFQKIFLLKKAQLW